MARVVQVLITPTGVLQGQASGAEYFRRLSSHLLAGVDGICSSSALTDAAPPASSAWLATAAGAAAHGQGGALLQPWRSHHQPCPAQRSTLAHSRTVAVAGSQLAAEAGLQLPFAAQAACCCYSQARDGKQQGRPATGAASQSGKAAAHPSQQKNAPGAYPQAGRQQTALQYGSRGQHGNKTRSGRVAGSSRSRFKGRKVSGLKTSGRDTPVSKAKARHAEVYSMQELQGMVDGMEADSARQQPAQAVHAMRKVVGHMESRPDYSESEGFNAQERQLVDRLTAMALPAAPDILKGPDAVTALYACARGAFWHPQLLSAMMDLLEADGCAMLREHYSGEILGKLGFMLGETAYVADKGRGNAVAHGLVQRATKAGGVMHTVADLVVSNQHTLNAQLQPAPQAACDLLLACMAIPYAHHTQLLDALLAALAKHGRDGLEDLHSRHIGNALYAVAIMASEHGYVPESADIEVLAKRIAQMVRSPDCTVPGVHMSKSIHGLAHCRHYNPGLLKATERALSVQHIIRNLTAQECANLLWGMAVFEYEPDSKVISSLSTRLLACKPGPQALVNSVWAMTVLGLPKEYRPAASCVLDAAGTAPPAVYIDSELCQLWQVHEAAQRLGLPQLQLTGQLRKRAREAAEAEMMKAIDRKQVRSPADQQMLAALQQLSGTCSADTPLPLLKGLGQLLGLRVLPEEACMLRHSPQPVHQRQPDAYYMALDAVVEATYTVRGGAVRKSKVAVVFDYPAQFCSNKPCTQRSDGPTRLRNERLRHAFNGLLLTVPVHEWTQKPSTELIGEMLQRVKQMIVTSMRTTKNDIVQA